MTTKSGQARRDLIAMFEEAQRVVSAEREHGRHLRAVVRQAVSNSRAVEDGGHVDVHMPLTDWQALRSAAYEQ
ncbi:hypothetical protein RVR_10603 [Actinacidiphila reveromycinica]|uniref:Uncharacterized protein n=1 Tax=Actinacidiphila reveromycinica TaxID=659352 RepID=A0A7U3VRD2_9ACTN|nr:hypothetical protein [Streptomyces sp. SN-593]BBB00604.1 hypothetical protein RVR_7742 [Streptomyces sp. SN-593]BBB00657.1 hypothetical protein RVR_10603 [Streptomyces sp. SN-593]